MTALILLAHGSRHGETAAALHSLADKVQSSLPSPSCGGPSHVRIAWLDLIQPDLDTVCAELAADGVRDAVAVPLLFTDAFHSRVDVPEQIEATSHHGVDVTVTAVLGLGDGVRRTVVQRIIEAAGAGSVGSGMCKPRHNDVLIMAVGSSDTQANADVHNFAAELDALLPGNVAAAFVVGPEEIKGAVAVEQARACAAEKNRGLIVVPLFTAPGLLWDKVRLAESGSAESGSAQSGSTVRYAEPLGDLLAPIICCRWDSAPAQRQQRNGRGNGTAAA